MLCLLGVTVCRPATIRVGKRARRGHMGVTRILAELGSAVPKLTTKAYGDTITTIEYIFTWFRSFFAYTSVHHMHLLYTCTCHA